MTEKMEKFLSSIDIEDFESFDFDFESIKKDDLTWVFNIKKSSPWTFDLLEFFEDKLNTIDYKYRINFEYPFDISYQDIVSLLLDFASKNGYNDLKEKIKETPTGIYFSDDLNNEKFSSFINEFQSLINFINYPRVYIGFEEKEEVETADEESEENSEEYFKSLETDEDSQISQENIKDESFEEFSNKRDDEIQEQIKAANDNLRNTKAAWDKQSAGLNNADRYKMMTLDDINEPNLSVLCSASVFSSEDPRGLNNGKIRYKFGIHDGKSSFFLTAITSKYLTNDLLKDIKRGTRITFTGHTKNDKYQRNELAITADSIRVDGQIPLRDDLEENKRVELHLHSNFSAMDGITNITDYCELASHMGMKAIAITDHGVVQAFPEAQKAAKKYNLKMLYGCELYVVDDYFEPVYNSKNIRLKDATYVVYDLETTGLSMRYDSIIEFGAVKIKNGLIIDRLDILINPGFKLNKKTTDITHITDEMLLRKPTISEAIDQIMAFIKDSVLVSHNLKFDYGFLSEAYKRCGKGTLSNSGIDTLALSRYDEPASMYHNLGAVCRRNDVFYDESTAHRADYDAEVLAHVWINFLYKYQAKNEEVSLLDLTHLKKEQVHIKHSRESHIVALCKNKAGLKDLYKLVSFSHIDYLGRVPCVPKSLLDEYRSNLILGSACLNGDVFQQASTGSEADLEKAIFYFDYIELQPLCNYTSLLFTNSIQSLDILKKYLLDIVDSAKKLNKIIVATGDCHYLNPEDKIFRDIYIAAPGIGKAAHPLNFARRDSVNPFPNPDQHFKSTREMLDDFEWFGKDNAYEWVVTNTNKIADSCESITPIEEDKLFTPTIDNCDKILVDICYKNAHKLYGDPLPEFVENRLKKELDGIIGAGYYVTYYIAHMIIKKAHEDGYIVGSRGSVGSSFAATMAEITEVNPLPPHYRCPKCKHFELYEGSEFYSGYDLPEKKCPNCGEIMIGDGQNIPFETFLGFNADKVPDIDLNFPPDYQSRAHEYTKVLLGADNVFRAGTISTASDKTAFGYAKGFLERSKKLTTQTTNAEIGYLASGCIGVKRTTGQHPGGIVVIPRGYEVYDFTPVQYPADDLDASWKTTHFEFESIHDTLLKLDLLGHVDPQALKMLCDLSNIKESDIPLNDKKVLSIFSSPKELNLLHNYLGVKNGAIALPEFGTDFVRKLLEDTKPTTFAGLLIVSGLSHGTDVWRNNQDALIQSRTTDLRGLIGCRDDIMTYLMSKGVDSSDAFKIMEKVRHGAGLTPEQEGIMRVKGVPEYYINSCKKIQYLFPKAHATAYVTNAVRVAWFKVYKPLEFYATFFSVRSDKFEWETMYNGPEAIMRRLKELEELKKIPGKFTKLHEDVQKTLYAALEMYDRGISFSNISLDKSDCRNFLIDREHNSLIPPFSVIDGLGDTVAISLVNARNNHPFTSVDDLIARGKINNTQLEIFTKLGILDNLNKSDVEQLNLFDC